MIPENGAQSYRDDGRLAENANFMILQERVRPPVQAVARLNACSAIWLCADAQYTSDF